jgi:hypothetical protein
MDSFTLDLLNLFGKRHSLSLTGLAAILNVDPYSLADPINYLREQGYIKIEPNTHMLHGDEFTAHTPFELHTPGALLSMRNRNHENDSNTPNFALGSRLSSHWRPS